MPIIKGIIVGHGNFSEVMLKTAEQIVGKQDYVELVSNTRMSCALLNEELKKVVENTNKHETIVFVDLPGGSCTISCYNLLKNREDLNVICGINLPVLIEFFMLREKYPAEQLVPILVKKGKESIFKLEKK
ncbi:MAG: PTS mannose transporter subunit IIAB [candidate division WOR-3 bacterium]|nr:MAG: PTS mannose transporter subunit IIAB [candidate division WOR-3 bacterium]